MADISPKSFTLLSLYQEYRCFPKGIQNKQGSLYYQPKQCTFFREIPQNYHTCGLFDSPQMDFFYWSLTNLHEFRPKNLSSTTHPPLCLHIVPAQLENNGRQHQDGSQPSATSRWTKVTFIWQQIEWFLVGYVGWNFSIARPRNLVMMSFCWQFFHVFSIFDDFVGKLAAYFSSFKTENFRSLFCKQTPSIQAQKKNLASATEWPYLN